MRNLIIIPTYNERDNINSLIPLIFDSGLDVHVLVVDDNSPDGTSLVVNNLKSKYSNLNLLLREKKEGLGKAYTHAFLNTLKDTDITKIIMMDSDFSHDPIYLKEMLAFDDGVVVIGSRYTKGGKTVGWELWRRVLSFLGNLYCRFITRMPINDCTGGFNVIPTNILKRVDFESLDMSGYAFIMQLKYMLYKNGAKFKEIPIIFKNRAMGETKISGHIISEGILAPIKMIWKK